LHEPRITSSAAKIAEVKHDSDPRSGLNWPTLTLWLLVTISLLVPVTPGFAKEWEIKEFEVLAIDPYRGDLDRPELLGLGYMAEDIISLVIRLSRMSPKDFEAARIPLVEIHPDAKLLMESHLSATAIELERWGFPEPRLEPVVTTADGRRAYRVYIVASGSDLLTPDAAGAYHGRSCVFGAERPEESIIVLDSNDMLINQQVKGVRALSTLSHELVHATQWATRFFGGSCTKSPGDWITEGTASAIGWDLARKYSEAPDPTVSAKPFWGARSYSKQRLPLSENDGLPIDEKLQRYWTSSFWRYLAEYQASIRGAGGPPTPAPGPVDYSYLADFLSLNPAPRDCIHNGAECDAEVAALDGWLKSRYDDKGLRERFTRFVANLAGYDEYRPVFDNYIYFQQDTLDSCSTVLLSSDMDAEDGPSHRTRLSFAGNAGKKDGMQDLSAWCRTVTMRGFGDGAVIPVEVVVSGPSKELLAQLTAAISLPQGALADTRPAVESLAQGKLRARWVFNFKEDQSIPLLLANVAERAEDTLPLQGRFPVTLTALFEYAKLTSSSGPTAAEIDSPIALDLNKIRGNIARDRNFDAYENACTLVLGLSDGEGTELSLAITHDGPIGPGNYDISAIGDTYRRIPQEFPGTFIMGASLGARHPLSSEGIRQRDFHSVAGSVEIKSVNSGLMLARVKGVLERCRDCMAIGSKQKPFGLTNLAIQAEFAVLVTDPEFQYAHGRDHYGSNCLVNTPPGDSPERPGKGPGKNGSEQDESGSKESASAASDKPAQPGTGTPVSDQPVPAGAEDTSTTPAPGTSGRSPGGTSTPERLPEGVNALQLQTTGDVQKTVSLAGDKLRLTGGCNGSQRLSIGFNSGDTTSPDWLYFAFDSVAVVGTGETGSFELSEVRWDDGKIDHTVPGGLVVKLPNRFSGAGTLTIDRHQAEISNRRMTGTVVANVKNRDGRSSLVSAQFGVNLSCGVNR